VSTFWGLIDTNNPDIAARLAALALARMKLCHMGRRNRHGHPSGDGPGMFSCLRIIGDARKTPAHLNDRRQLALPLKNFADRGGIFIGDNIHPRDVGVSANADKRADDGSDDHARYPVTRNAMSERRGHPRSPSKA
jgi:hypothetical protein